MPSLKMESNPAWKGGKISSHSAGYIRIKLSKNDPFYPMAHSDGYVYEHRLIKAKELNRCLTKGEKVHHDDQKKDNNINENLDICTQSEHIKIHKPKTTFIRYCEYCGKPSEYKNWQIKDNKSGRFFCCRLHCVKYSWSHRPHQHKKTLLLKNKIVELHKNDNNISEIARMFKMCRKTVRAILKEQENLKMGEKKN